MVPWVFLRSATIHLHKYQDTTLGSRRNVVVFVKSGEWIVQYQEDRSYTSPVTDLQASKYGNTYYHLQLECTHVQHGQHLYRVILWFQPVLENACKIHTSSCSLRTLALPYTTKISPRENFRQFRQWTSMAKIFSSNIFPILRGPCRVSCCLPR